MKSCTICFVFYFYEALNNKVFEKNRNHPTDRCVTAASNKVNNPPKILKTGSLLFIIRPSWKVILSQYSGFGTESLNDGVGFFWMLSVSERMIYVNLSLEDSWCEKPSMSIVCEYTCKCRSSQRVPSQQSHPSLHLCTHTEPSPPSSTVWPPLQMWSLQTWGLSPPNNSSDNRWPQSHRMSLFLHH